MADYIKKNIGKNTIGDNNKMSVNLRTYNRSTHDMSYVWRNTQSPGTIVPFMCLLGQKGDTWDINLNAQVLTHPTTGPLFGSFKHESFVFTVPHRLYNSWLHNNRINIGLNMSQIKLPQLKAYLKSADNPYPESQFTQINPSCLLAYLGIRGYGTLTGATGASEKNAIPILGYYDICKNYFFNKQENDFWIIGGNQGIQLVSIGGINYSPGNIRVGLDSRTIINIKPVIKQTDLIFNVLKRGTTGRVEQLTASDLGTYTAAAPTCEVACTKVPDPTERGGWTLVSINIKGSTSLLPISMENIEIMRDKIFAKPGNQKFVISSDGDSGSLAPYTLFGQRDQQNNLFSTYPQMGLALKTYQSDMLQNWINTEWIDGEDGINAISAVSVTGGSFTMDALNLAKKVYDMLNRIAVSGGTYKDWLETVYTGDYIERCETPVFEGGMSQEIVFQEVVSNSATEGEPLGSLAGRGTLSRDRRGGQIKVRCTEPCFLIGVTCITPRIDYSQGNEFFIDHKTMDDLHKPQLDGIGYQDLLTNQMAWWDSQINTSNVITNFAAGKTVAWINYMTNYNKNYGNFAIDTNEAFMVLNRRYELDISSKRISDLTTYIDPAKYNYIFADGRLDAMNFWVQIGSKIELRRIISAKIIPNL